MLRRSSKSLENLQGTCWCEQGFAVLLRRRPVSTVHVRSRLSWTLFAVLESVKLANVLIKTLMSQGMQNGLLSTQLQLPVDKTLLVAVITRLATLRKQHLLAMTAVQQLSHDITPSEEQQLTQTPGSQILGHHHTTHMMTLVSHLAVLCKLAAPRPGMQLQTSSALHVGFDAAPRQIVSKRYRVVREPFTAPPVQQSSTTTQQGRRRRHRVLFAGMLPSHPPHCLICLLFIPAKCYVC